MEKHEFQKFTKYFCTRVIQSVVQARTGDKVCHTCTEPPEGSDWFNFRVDELGEIAAYIRTSIHGFPPSKQNVNLDFFLYTAFGDFLPLESWKLSVDSNKCDSQVSVCGSFYHQLGTLLKSVVAAARVTPMYRYYVKKQSADTFVVFYRIYEGPSEISLGADKVQTRLGSLPSPFGTLCVDLAYRTNMEVERDQTMSKSVCCAPQGVLSKNKPASASCPRFLPLSTKVPSGTVETEIVSPVEETIAAFSTSPNTHSDSASEKRISFQMGQSSSSEDITIPFLDRRSRESRTESALSRSSLRRSNRKQPPADAFPFASLLTLSLSDNPPRSRRHSELVKLEERTEQEDLLDESPRKECGTTETNPSIISGLRHCSTVPSACNLMIKESESCHVKGLDDVGEESPDDDPTLSQIHVLSFSTSEDLGTDLKELVQRCREAPTSLEFLHSAQNYSNLSNQLTEFQNHVNEFDDFVAKVRKQSECDD